MTAGEYLLNSLLSPVDPPWDTDNFASLMWSLNTGTGDCGSVFWKVQALASRLNPDVHTGLDTIMSALVDFVNDVAHIVDGFALKIRDGEDVSNLLHAIMHAVPDIRAMLSSIGISEHHFQAMMLSNHDVLAHAIYALVHAAKLPSTDAYMALRQISTPSWISKADVLKSTHDFAMLSFALAQAPEPALFEADEARTFVRELLEFARHYKPLDGLKQAVMRAKQPVNEASCSPCIFACAASSGWVRGSIRRQPCFVNSQR